MAAARRGEDCPLTRHLTPEPGRPFEEEDVVESPDDASVVRWLAFDHPGSPEPVGLLRVLPDGTVEYLDRDGAWAVDPALSPGLLAGRTREISTDEAAEVAQRLRAGRAR